MVPNVVSDSFGAAVFVFSCPCHCRIATLCHRDALCLNVSVIKKQLFGRASEKSSVRLPHCATVKTHLHRALLNLAYNGPHIHFFCRASRCTTLLCNKLHIVPRDKNKCIIYICIYAHAHHSDVSGKSGYGAGVALSTISQSVTF